VLPELERERDVIAVDLPGFGGSPTMPIGVQPNIAALTDSVIAFLDEIEVERPVVGGNSLGGWIALEIAKRGRARAVVGVSPAGFAEGLDLKLAMAHLKASVFGARQKATQALLKRPRGRVLAFGGMMGHPDRVSYADALRTNNNLATSPGFDATLAAVTLEGFTGGEQVDVPVTLLWGTRDFVLLPRQGRLALKALPHARLVPLEGAGHVPMWDEPHAIASELLAASATPRPASPAPRSPSAAAPGPAA
jgi:pimeloyl-ACP methyl ester carboxylesterase